MEVTLGIELPLQIFELPVPDVPGRPLTSDTTDSRLSGSSDSTLKEFALDAGIFHGSELSISWKILGDRNSIELAPLELDAQRLPGKGARIRLVSQFSMILDCVSISESDGLFVLDFITSLGALNTVLIPHSWLLETQKSYPPLPEISISRPFSFDLVSPRIMKAVSPRLLVLSLIDGSFVRLDRDSPLGAVTHLVLTDHVSSNTGSGFARFFKGSQDKVPGHPSLSVNSAVSLEIVDHNTIVTYSVNNTVRVWSLRSNTCTQFIQSNDSSSPFRMRPTSFVSCHKSQVAVAFPSEIKVYEFLKAEETLKEIPLISTKLSDEMRSWFLTSLCLLDSGLILAAFKLNISARIYLINKNSWSLVGGYDYSGSLDLPENASVPAIKSQIYELPPTIIKLAFQQLVPEFASTLVDINDVDNDLSIAMNKAFPNVSESDMQTEWLRLDTLCRELHVQASELLTIAPALATNTGMFFWTLRVAGITILSINMSEDNNASEQEDDEALSLARGLLGTVPLDTFSRITNELLSSSQVLDRVDSVCELLKPHLDQLKLNEVGRSMSQLVAPAIQKYIKMYGVMETNFENERIEDSSLTQLSELGFSAVSSLVYDFSVSQASKFQVLSALTVIALVEGWLANGNDADLLSTSVACLRRLTILGELGINKLRLDITNTHLECFGISLARNIIAKVDTTSLLTQLLPPFVKAPSPQEFADFERIIGFCEASAELSLLRCLAALSSGEESTGVALAQQLSLSRAWPQSYGERPQTQSAWFLEVAKYAESVNARDAALWLVQYGESLSSPKDPQTLKLLEYLFRLSVNSGDITVAYTALTRRFKKIDSAEYDQLELWIKELISAAARKSAEDARTLIVSYPFIGFATALQKTLANNVSFATVPAYKLRYAWHVEREDFVGAAQVIYDHLRSEQGIEAVRKAELYTICLNALAVADVESRWLACGDRLVTYEDVKLEHKALLDDMTAQINAVSNR